MTWAHILKDAAIFFFAWLGIGLAICTIFGRNDRHGND
jgi:hypothetical protein